MMRILVDADACPVKKNIVRVAKHFNLDIIMIFDSSHVYDDGYSNVMIIDQGRDSVDFVLVNLIHNDDIVVTQDYGLACISLSKGANVINQDGLIYTNDNIDILLHQRYVSSKIRKEGLKTKGPRKRTLNDDIKFESIFFDLIKKKFTNTI